MGQGDIAEILKQHYPQWLSFRDVMDKIDLSRNSVLRSLRCLNKHNDVEVKIIMLENSQRNKVTYYRIRK